MALTFAYQGKTYSFPDDPTLDQLDDFERAAGVSWDKAKDMPRAKALKAMVWVAVHESDPAFTFEQAGRLRLSEIDIQDEEPANPTRPAPQNRAARRASRSSASTSGSSRGKSSASRARSSSAT